MALSRSSLGSNRICLTRKNARVEEEKFSSKNLSELIDKWDESCGMKMKQYFNLVKDDKDFIESLTIIENKMYDLCVKCNVVDQIFDILMNVNWANKLFSKDETADEIANKLLKVFGDVLSEFISLNPFYVENVLNFIMIPLLKGMKNLDHLEDKISITKRELKVFDKVHGLVSDFLVMVPKMNIIKHLKSAYPFPGVGLVHSHYCYAYNVLQSYFYVESKRSILVTFFDKLIRMDLLCANMLKTQLYVDDEDMLFEMDELKDGKQTLEQIEKGTVILDHTMQLLFEFIDLIYSKSKENDDHADVKELYEIIEKIFVKTILNSRSSHVQFALFYLTSLDENCTKQFTNVLWSIIASSASYEMQRSAVFYLGSYLSRANFVDIDSVIRVLSNVSQWLHTYIDRTNYIKLSGEQQENEDHSIFHTLCQTIFYVFVHRCDELEQTKLTLIRKLQLQRVVTCSLNPLEKCNPYVLRKFAELAVKYNIAFCYAIIERNKRNARRSEIIVASGIKPFYPFDPYQLKISSNKIEPLYRLYIDNQSQDESDDDSIASMENRSESDGMSSSCSPVKSSQYFYKMLDKASPMDSENMFCGSTDIESSSSDETDN